MDADKEPQAKMSPIPQFIILPELIRGVPGPKGKTEAAKSRGIVSVTCLLV